MRTQDKYQWPANKLTEYEMSILHEWRSNTGTPINHLIKQAIIALDKIIKKGDDANGINNSL